MRHLLGCTLAVALVGCSTLRGDSRLESSVVLQANQRCTLTVTPADAGGTSLDLRGLGPGGVTFDVRNEAGATMAHGVLNAGSTANCFASDGALVVSFTGDATGGTVAYVVHTRSGGVATTVQQ